MRCQGKIWAIVLAATACASARGGEPTDGQPHGPGFFQRLRPRGGWNPDGGGLFHWWNPHCFPRTCGPDDYCRKPMPAVCRPSLPYHIAQIPDHPYPVPAPPVSQSTLDRMTTAGSRD
jgi:hypothetical protein